MSVGNDPATFRQIVTLTKKPAVRVSVVYGGLRGDRHYHALSTVRKHEWGAMVVDTTVFVPTDLVEIIAHELEHVCEQVEGVDLRTLAGRRGEGVYNLNGHFETDRAIRRPERLARIPVRSRLPSTKHTKHTRRRLSARRRHQNRRRHEALSVRPRSSSSRRRAARACGRAPRRR